MAALRLIIGNRNYSSWSLRPWLALRHAGLGFEEEVIPLDLPDTRARILARSPAGRVPVLIHGDTTVWDSLAIIEYVAELAPEAGLWPRDPHARAMARAIAAEMHSGFPAMRRALPMNIRRARRPVAGGDEVEADLERVREIWRPTRQRFGQGGPFLFGAFTAADAMYAPVVTRFDTYLVPVDERCAAYIEAIQTLPAMVEWNAADKAEPWSMPRHDD